MLPREKDLAYALTMTEQALRDFLSAGYRIADYKLIPLRAAHRLALKTLNPRPDANSFGLGAVELTRPDLQQTGDGMDGAEEDAPPRHIRRR